MRKVLALTMLLLTGCVQQPTATVLYFLDQEKGIEPYRTRMVVTGDFLRIDDGTDSRDFILFSRKERVIYNVSAGDKLVLVIRGGGKVEAAPALKHEVVREADQPPAVGGKPVTHYRLLTNGTTCYDLYAAQGLLPDAVTVLREFIFVLAADQAGRIGSMPRELLTPCYLANNIYAPARYLDHGLPVRRADHDGRVSELVDFSSDFAANPALFVLPADYRQLDIGALRGAGR